MRVPLPHPRDWLPMAHLRMSRVEGMNEGRIYNKPRNACLGHTPPNPPDTGTTSCDGETPVVPRATCAPIIRPSGVGRGDAPPTPCPPPPQSAHPAHEPQPQPPNRHSMPRDPQRPTKPRAEQGPPPEQVTSSRYTGVHLATRGGAQGGYPGREERGRRKQENAEEPPERIKRQAPVGVAVSTRTTGRRAEEAPEPRSTPAPDHPRRTRNRPPLPPPPKHPTRTPNRCYAKRRRPGVVHPTGKGQQTPPKRPCRRPQQQEGSGRRLGPYRLTGVETDQGDGGGAAPVRHPHPPARSPRAQHT
nr:uncharacterized protein LOC133579031 [Nerophis lumbriciformis]